MQDLFIYNMRLGPESALIIESARCLPYGDRHKIVLIRLERSGVDQVQGAHIKSFHAAIVLEHQQLTNHHPSRRYLAYSYKDSRT